MRIVNLINYYNKIKIFIFQSQIPGPVTPEQLEQEKERKAQQKKAKRQREKERQADKMKGNAFLLLSDDQKVRHVIH